MTSVSGRIAAVWGVLGVLSLLGTAVGRLSVKAVAAFATPLGPLHWAGLAASLLFLGYFEGYKAFQRGFSPRVVARASYLAKHPTPVRLVLAPLFCMGFFHATRRRKIAAFGVTFGVIGLVLAVHLLAQPWRGIVDAGVVVALAWGMAAILAFAARAARGHPMPVPPDVPADP